MQISEAARTLLDDLRARRVVDPLDSPELRELIDARYIEITSCEPPTGPTVFVVEAITPTGLEGAKEVFIGPRLDARSRR